MAYHVQGSCYLHGALIQHWHTLSMWKTIWRALLCAS